MYRLLYIHVFLCSFSVTRSFCPSQCTCIYHGRTDGTGTRSVLCSDPDMSDIPTNIPVDTIKLRVEKTAIRRVPTEAFYYLPDLRYLWVTYSQVSALEPGALYNLKALHELRLDGNQLAAFPWEALRETPRLRTLDLHNNRLVSVPVEAVPLLRNLTYLDLSSNKLATLPSNLMDLWPPFSGPFLGGNSDPRVVVGLQDNPWFCDCRISKLIEVSKTMETTVVLLDPSLACSGPENLAGVLFQRAVLEQCLKPTVMTSATKITSPPGSNVLMRCDATGYPTPTLAWARSNGSPINNTAVQESPGEGIRWSIISLNAVQYQDAGEYRCKATNVAGTSESSISLVVVSVVVTTTVSPQRVTERPDGEAQTVITTVTTTWSASTNPPPPAVTLPLPAKSRPPPPNGQQRALLEGKKLARMPQEGVRKAGNSSTLSSPSPAIRDLRVVEVSVDSVVLLWSTEGVQGNVPLTAVYSPFQEKVKQTATAEAGSGRLALTGLKPKTKYMTCLLAKGGPSRRDQCTTFSTLEPVEAGGSSWALIIAAGTACVLVLPMIALLLYKILSLYCKGGRRGGEDDLSKETYVQFEELTVKQRAAGGQPYDMWARRQTQESEMMLLCSRSSIDSQMTYKSDTSKSEYLC